MRSWNVGHHVLTIELHFQCPCHRCCQAYEQNDPTRQIKIYLSFFFYLWVCLHTQGHFWQAFFGRNQYLAMWIKCLAQGHNTWCSLGLNLLTLDLESDTLPLDNTAPLISSPTHIFIYTSPDKLLFSTKKNRYISYCSTINMWQGTSNEYPQSTYVFVEK